MVIRLKLDRWGPPDHQFSPSFLHDFERWGSRHPIQGPRSPWSYQGGVSILRFYTGPLAGKGADD